MTLPAWIDELAPLTEFELEVLRTVQGVLSEGLEGETVSPEMARTFCLLATMVQLHGYDLNEMASYIVAVMRNPQLTNALFLQLFPIGGNSHETQ